MAFASWDSYGRFKRRVFSESPYMSNDEDQAFLRTVIETSGTRRHELPQGAKLWRAQKAYVSRDFELSPGEFESLPQPCNDKRMVPTAEFATDGRISLAGVPVLYTANRQDTAIAETRPWIGRFLHRPVHPLNI